MKKMRFVLKKYVLVLAFILMAPSIGYCTIWDEVQSSLDRSTTHLSYDEIASSLELLTPPDAVQKIGDAESGIKYVIANGHIVITPESIQSFSDAKDYLDPHSVAEFTWSFQRGIAPPQEVGEKAAELVKQRPEGKMLAGMEILTDMIPSHEYFDKIQFGTLSYKEFVEKLQCTLDRALLKEGAIVTHLRPDFALSAGTVDATHAIEYKIAISLQFNNDHQDCMTTFCGGNSSAKELASHPRQRARFIQAAVTGKHLFSVGLGACIMGHCQRELAVRPLPWNLATFEGNARPISISMDSPRVTSHLALLERGEVNFAGRAGSETDQMSYYHGVATRNLAQHGIFAKAVVVPFPDMQWVQKHIQASDTAQAIDLYAKTIANAIVDFVKQNPDAF